MAVVSISGIEDQSNDLRFTKADARYTQDRGVLVYPCQNCAFFISPDMAGGKGDDPWGWCVSVGKVGDPNGRRVLKTGTSALWRHWRSPARNRFGVPGTANIPLAIKGPVGQTISTVYQRLPIPSGRISTFFNNIIGMAVESARKRGGV